MLDGLPTWVRSLQPRDRLWAQFPDDADFWHERILLSRISNSSWLVVTAHGDIYEEDFAEYLDIGQPGSRGGVPARIRDAARRGRVVAFGDVSQATLDAWVEQARRLRKGLRSEDGGPDASSAVGGDSLVRRRIRGKTTMLPVHRTNTGSGALAAGAPGRQIPPLAPPPVDDPSEDERPTEDPAIRRRIRGKTPMLPVRKVNTGSGALAAGAPGRQIPPPAPPPVEDPFEDECPAEDPADGELFDLLGRGDTVWLSLEDRGGLTVGAPIPPRANWIGGHVDRALFKIGDEVVAAGRVGTFAPPTPRGDGGGEGPARDASRTGAAGDLRTLAVRYDPRGVRSRPFADATAALVETQFPDWGVHGPRTFLWLVLAISSQGFTPLQRHFWWRNILRLTASDAGVDEHQFLSELIEQCLSFDQLNGANLLAMESVARRYQLWEEMYSSHLAVAESGDSSADWLDERRLFLGHARSRGHALVSPLLEKWVAEKLAEESAVLKERRKGREERALARGAISTTDHDKDKDAAAGRARGRGRGNK